MTLTWDDGTAGATAAYSWTLLGNCTLAGTASNRCGQVSGTLPVAVSPETYRIYLPVILWGSQ